MELTLTRHSGTQIAVACDGWPSHTFELRMLAPSEDQGLPHPPNDPVAFGQVIYRPLFPPATVAQHLLDAAPERIVLVASDNDIDAILWEYAYRSYAPEKSESFLILEDHLVRGLPAD